MPEAQTISISIERPWRDVYEAAWRPSAFATWASGLVRGSLRRDGDEWHAEGPAGPIRIRFTGQNPFGVMDHSVELADGTRVDVPMRVVANGDGAEVLLTVFRLPGMSDAKFQEDLDWVRRDLRALREVVSR